jgi:DNA helicase-2/ATP-dependent DNA helicase PcrA
LREFAGGNSVSEVIKYIQAETGYVDKLMNENSFEARNRIENLKELITAAKSFEENNDGVSVSNFLDQAALVSDIDSFDDKHGSVALMTLHNSKGLEFPVVFITGMEERIFPHIRSMSCEEEMEEERRLCYVGMTRTKNRLFFLNAVTRKIYGMELTNPPSEFIEDIPAELIETISPSQYNHSSLTYNRFPRKIRQQIDGSKFSIGTKVAHSTFGNGIILDVNGSNDEEILSVFFKGAGKKKLKSKYADLKIL